MPFAVTDQPRVADMKLDGYQGNSANVVTVLLATKYLAATCLKDAEHLCGVESHVLSGAHCRDSSDPRILVYARGGKIE